MVSMSEVCVGRCAIGLTNIDHRDHGQTKCRNAQEGGHVASTIAIVFLHMLSQTANRHRQSTCEQGIHENTTQDAGEHDLVESARKHGRQNDQLCKVAERCIEQSTDRRPHMGGNVFRRLTKHGSQRYQRKHARDEDQQRLIRCEQGHANGGGDEKEEPAHGQM